jgi:hypothetical protein
VSSSVGVLPIAASTFDICVADFAIMGLSDGGATASIDGAGS